jgi:transcription-repair coupling factor (superfamily II helicase)
MSLEGIRDFSVIATAPQRRLAIKTFVAPYSSGIIREAALRELKRGGQIYFPAQRHRHDRHQGENPGAIAA